MIVAKYCPRCEKTRDMQIPMHPNYFNIEMKKHRMGQGDAFKCLTTEQKLFVITGFCPMCQKVIDNQ